MVEKRLRPEDVEDLVHNLGLLEKALGSVRFELLCAMDRVNYTAGRMPMNYLYRAQGDLIMARSHIAKMLPADVLPPADMAPDLVQEWLRKRETKE